eukprot:scaffold19963_cov102-Phaeocystis_antarctica.AAC.1
MPSALPSPRSSAASAAAALHHTRCTCRAACRLRVSVEHAADRRLRGRKITGLPARARHNERRAPHGREEAVRISKM